jgi:hypothetical protein
MTFKVILSQNLLYNGGFEDGDHYGDNIEGKMLLTGRLDHWISDCSNCDQFNAAPYHHSPDWFDIRFGYCQQPFEGYRLLGMDRYELIEQKINADFIKNDILYCKFQLFKGSWNPGNFPKYYEGMQLKVYLANERMQYIPYNVESDFCVHKDQIGQDIICIKTIDLNSSEIEVDEWNKISFFFEAPDPSYNWFAIEVVRPNAICGHDGLTYIYLDDVQLMHYCNHPCMTDFAPIEILSGIPNVCYVNMNPGVWNVKVKNAQRITLIVFDLYGGEHIFSDFDVNGLLDDQWGYDYYTFIWNGYETDFSPFPQDEYTFKLNISNCNETQSYEGRIMVFPNGEPIVVPELNQMEFDNDDCCIPNLFLSNIVDVSNYYLVSNSIITGGQYFNIPQNGHVTFDAGEEIIIGPGFHAYSGSDFTAKICGCNSDSRSYSVQNSTIEDNSAVVFKLSDFSSTVSPVNDSIDVRINIYPNPTNDFLYVSSNSLLMQVEIMSTIGSVLIYNKEMEHNNKIDVSNLEPGVYLSRLTTVSGIVVNKQFVKY